jgi:integrase
MPFTQNEVERLLKACERIDNPNKREIARARLRARALVLLLLYSGFRISDAVKLERSALDANGRLLVRIMKTRAPLYIRLPDEAVAALLALPVESKYFFWSGKAKLSTAIGSARRTIDCILDLAEVKDGHPHRFRDTFSVALLNEGADLRTVQLLLGHSSLKTTEKHYAPFVVSMQRILDEAVSKLHFLGPTGPTLVNSKHGALRDAKTDVLALPRPKRA